VSRVVSHAFLQPVPSRSTGFYVCIKKGAEVMSVKWKKRWGLLCLSLLLVLGAVGCAPSGGTEGRLNTPVKPAAVKYPVEVTDQAGNKVTIKQEPKRIVSLMPSNTEIAYALGLDQKMVGVTTNDDYPAAVKKLPKVGDFKINVEKVVSLKPDLVLANGANDKATLEQLKKLGIPVLVLDAKSFKDIYRSIAIIATATNTAREADLLIAKMQKEHRDIYAKVVNVPKDQRVKVFVELDPTLYTVGGDTFMNELVTTAGGVNVAAGLKGWPQVSAEQVVKWNPDIIISSYGSTDQILKRQGWSTVNAIKGKRVYVVDPNLTNRPGPRIFQGVKEMAEQFYPERFGEQK
jgi:iron complex transport system substrate-binding protein